MDNAFTMDWWLFSFIFGAILSLFLPEVPVIFYILLLAFVAVCQLYQPTVRKLNGLFFGAAWMLLSAWWQFNSLAHNDVDVNTLHLSTHTLTGEIKSLIGQSDDIRFNFLIKRINGEQLTRPFLVRLSWPVQPTIEAPTENAVLFALKQGQHWQLNTKLKPAHGFANNTGFSYQTWLLKRKIVATGYVKNSELNQVIENNSSLRQQLFDLLNEQRLSHINSTNKALLLALVVGDKQQFSENHWQVLSATNTQHLMAISGLHLGLVASLFFMISKLLIWLLPASAVCHRSVHLVPIFMSVMVACIYAALAGFSAPTVRALMMIFVYWLIRLSKIHLTVTRWLLLSLFLIVLLIPFSLFDSSFWLSCIAVVVIFIGLWRYRIFVQQQSGWRQFILSLLLVQLVLTVFLLPVNWLLYQQLSGVSLIANIVVVPIMSLMVIPLALSAVLFSAIPSISEWLFSLSSYMLSMCWRWLVYLANLPAASITLSNAMLITVTCLLLIVMLLVVLPMKHKQRIALSMLFIVVAPVVFYSAIHLQQKLADKNWQLTALDVGHGLSVVIEKNNRVTVYDTGATYPSGFSISESILLPFITRQGIHHIDQLIISHDDNDHAGGLTKLLEMNKVTSLIYNNQSALTENKPCIAGKQWFWQGLKFSVLWPLTAKAAHNDDSCVLLISDGENKVLLTGDISKKTEQQLLKRHTFNKVTVVVAPHHGSKSSSSAEFVNQLQAQHVIFSSGYLNRWLMPQKIIANRYAATGSVLHTTANQGAINVRFSGEGARVNHWRTQRPFWYLNQIYF